MTTFQKIWLLLAFMSIATAFSQNTKPIPVADTIRLNLNDSICSNIIFNDYDLNNDPIRLSKFGRWLIPNLTKDYSFKTDTAHFVINKSGKVCIKAKKAGTFIYEYIPQDGKAGAGRKGYCVVIVSNKSNPNNWMDIGCSGSLIYKDSTLKITVHKGSKVYKGVINKWETGCSIQGYDYKQWHGDNLVTIVGQWVLFLPLEVYEWAKD